MRTVGGFALGFAAGVLALGVFLYSTGKLQTSPPAPVIAPEPERVKTLPTPAQPDFTLPALAPQQLPMPPDVALAAAPAKPETAEIGLPLQNLKKESIQNSFDDTRGGGSKHEATDIIAARGTPVLAVVEGNVVKLFSSKKGGITVYEYDNQQKYCYYYAHLDRYADGIKEGMLLRKGDTLGYVGSTGDAQANNPHLHFAILELGPDKHWYEHTTAVNPYPLLLHALALK